MKNRFAAVVAAAALPIEMFDRPPAWRITPEVQADWMLHNVRCPGCRSGWGLFPPVKIHGADEHRCIECKRVYVIQKDGSATDVTAPGMVEP